MATAAKKTTQVDNVERSKKKVENFKRLATKRTVKALSAINGIGALSNMNSYTYDRDQVQKIIAAIDAARNAMVESFTKPQSAGKASFTL